MVVTKFPFDVRDVREVMKRRGVQTPAQIANALGWRTGSGWWSRKPDIERARDALLAIAYEEDHPAHNDDGSFAEFNRFVAGDHK